MGSLRPKRPGASSAASLRQPGGGVSRPQELDPRPAVATATGFRSDPQPWGDIHVGRGLRDLSSSVWRSRVCLHPPVAGAAWGWLGFQTGCFPRGSLSMPSAVFRNGTSKPTFRLGQPLPALRAHGSGHTVAGDWAPVSRSNLLGPGPTWPSLPCGLGEAVASPWGSVAKGASRPLVPPRHQQKRKREPLFLAKKGAGRGVWLGNRHNPPLAKMKPVHAAPTGHAGREGTKVLHVLFASVLPHT